MTPRATKPRMAAVLRSTTGVASSSKEALRW